MNIEDLVGKRVLVSVPSSYKTEVEEVKILEVSPSGNWVKLMNLQGGRFWRARTSVLFVEELHSEKERPLSV